ncbi:hypothetical protein V1264_017005 [Littorina saxatilis]|uniref:Uncharacterized protein n=1 Tax=Littorina saxatilis TaxID=31220 RepID=A0AAN9GG86_9CAEN
MYALIGIVGFLVVVNITVFVLCVVNIKKKRHYKRAAIRAHNAGTQGDSLHDRGCGSHFYEAIPDEAQLGPPRGYHRRQGQIPKLRGSPAPPHRPAVDSLPADYLHPVNDVSRGGINQPAGTTAAPAGPYESLEMSDMGLQSPYSQL